MVCALRSISRAGRGAFTPSLPILYQFFTSIGKHIIIVLQGKPSAPMGVEGSV